MKLIKKLLIKSYTRSYYYKKLDEIETIHMKASVHNEFKAAAHYVPSLIWLKFYTSIIDTIINALLILLMIAFAFILFVIMLLFWNLLNDFSSYY